MLLAEAAAAAAGILVRFIVGGFGDGAAERARQQQLGRQFARVAQVQWRRLLLGARSTLEFGCRAATQGAGAFCGFAAVAACRRCGWPGFPRPTFAAAFLRPSSRTGTSSQQQ